MFGLGWVELLIIAGLISLLAGPAALKKVMGAAREVNDVKNNFTGSRALQRMLDAELAKEDAEIGWEGVAQAPRAESSGIVDAELVPPPD